MNSLRHTYYIILALLLGFVSCTNETEIANHPEYCDPMVLRAIHAVIDNGGSTRAVTPLIDSIGKYKFMPNDEIIFTMIERTKRPIRPTFSYQNVHYDSEINGDDVSWKRKIPTNDIFWSDGSEPHTFIGYILPHEDAKTAEASGFDWHHDTEKDVYYGSIGNPAVASEMIDYTSSPLGTDRPEPYDLEKLRKEDLLLTYSTEMQNEDAMAWIRFHHGLASVRVTVTITGYSSTGTDPDAETKVTDMLLLDQPTMYKWDNKGYEAAPLEAGDQAILNGFTDWGGEAPAWNQKKTMKLWQPREYHGTGVGRTFSFYGIVAPGLQNEVVMTFKVSYPDPLDPNQEARLEKDYKATLKLDKDVEFRPGYCTSINVNLNHKDEKMTVGAEYMSWQNDDSPDEGSLRKNSTYLSYTGREKITIVGDAKATADDATWLYTATSGKIVDIYGNDGSAAHPFLICTADQLLSFAYEVKNGRAFEHQFVKLDADITLQPTKNVEDSKRVTWIGVGDASHPFNGFFLGSGRYINDLYGAHFFYTIGENAVIDKLNFGNVKEVQGCGVVAHENKGLICGCYIDGDVKETDMSAQYTGSIVGVNQSFIIACAHIGKVEGRGTIGGLVGFNNGTVMACYHCGEIASLDGSTNLHATVGKRGDGTDGTNKSIMFSCYFDNSLITHTPTLEPNKSGYPLSTSVMQSNAFVNSDRVFVYDTDYNTSQGKTLRQVVIEDILKITDEGQSIPQLAALVFGDTGLLSDNVWKLFEYHFSLNEAIKIFGYWLDAIVAQDKDNVKTNCHDFTKEQILFLKQHYNAEHKFIYTPATYPKVQ